MEEPTFKERIIKLMDEIDSCPANCRELSLVKTNLEQAMLWYTRTQDVMPDGGYPI